MKGDLLMSNGKAPDLVLCCPYCDVEMFINRVVMFFIRQPSWSGGGRCWKRTQTIPHKCKALGFQMDFIVEHMEKGIYVLKDIVLLEVEQNGKMPNVQGLV